MKIETKFDIGQEVWAIINGQSMMITLDSIYIKYYEGDDNARISYGIKEKFAEQTWRLPEEFFFSSKEELIGFKNS